jgi:hypothetical protein
MATALIGNNYSPSRVRRRLHSTRVVKLTRKEVIERLNSEARRRLGISATEMLRQHREGRLSDTGTVADLLMYASLLRPDDPIFGG